MDSRYRDGGAEFPSEYTAIRRDGTSFQLEVVSRRIEYDGKPALFATLRDLTERRRAEAAVVESEQRFRSLFEQAPIGIVLVGEDRRFVQVNNAFCAMLGYGADEFLGKSFVDVTHPEEAGDPPASARRILDDAASVLRLQERYVTKTGDTVDAETAISLTRDRAGRLLFAVAMIEDVTEKRMLEDRLRKAQRLESVGQLAGGVAHNFNNALTAIIGYSELLGRRFDHQDDGRKDVGQIQRVAEQSASLTRQLLTFSRKEHVKPSVFCLNAAVEATTTLLSPLISEKIRLRLRLDRTLKDSRADRSQIEQVVTNLVLNSRDAMPKSGTLTIETSSVDVGESLTRTHPDAQVGPYVRLSVTDTGSGMDEAVAERIFEPFFTIREPGEGVGLGLAMVHGAVQQAGGFIAFDTDPGRGTTFRIYLPVHREASLGAPAVDDAEAAGETSEETTTH